MGEPSAFQAAMMRQHDDVQKYYFGRTEMSERAETREATEDEVYRLTEKGRRFSEDAQAAGNRITVPGVMVNGPFPPAPPRPELSAAKLERCALLAKRKAAILEDAQESLDGKDWGLVVMNMLRVMTIEAEMRGIES